MASAYEPPAVEAAWYDWWWEKVCNSSVVLAALRVPVVSFDIRTRSSTGYAG
jgi:hypothetical protein